MVSTKSEENRRENEEGVFSPAMPIYKLLFSNEIITGQDRAKRGIGPVD
jgi:hypothetical protein